MLVQQLQHCMECKVLLIPFQAVGVSEMLMQALYIVVPSAAVLTSVMHDSISDCV
jgi:hypothetical protein